MITVFRRYAITALAVVGLIGAGLFGMSKNAAAADGEFSLQVSPSPLVVTLKPGQTTTYDLKIRNAGSHAENLKIAPRSFAIDNNTGDVKFDDTKKPVDIGDWISFGQENFSVQPGQWYTQKVTIAIPKSAGFSYSFGLVISRQATQPQVGAGQELKGSVAIFSLVTVDKPGATRTLQLDSLAADKSVYEYLPATLNVRLKNAGNTIVRPSGNIFIQRNSSDSTPISTLPVNKNEGYILPGSVRTLSVNWDDGFQVLHSGIDANGKPTEDLQWNWGNLSNIRIGRYTAKLVAIYNDGQRDIPVTGEVSFWVIPWKLLLGFLVVVLLLGFGLWSLISKVFKFPRRSGKNVTFRR